MEKSVDFESLTMSQTRWSQLQKQLQQHLDPDEFATWFRPLKVRDEGGQRLVLVAPNSRFLHTLEESYRPMVDRAVYDRLPSPTELTQRRCQAGGAPYLGRISAGWNPSASWRTHPRLVTREQKRPSKGTRGRRGQAAPRRWDQGRRKAGVKLAMTGVG